MAKSKISLGTSWVFMREAHDWHACEVSVIAIKLRASSKTTHKRYVVARCCDICDALLAPRGSAKRRIKRWTCSEKELW